MKFSWKQIRGKITAKWQRILASVVLSFFVFNTASSSVLAWSMVDTAQAQSSLGGMLNSAIGGLFGAGEQVLQKFSDRAGAERDKAATSGKKQFDLVAILVASDIAENSRNYDGLAASHNATVPAGAANDNRRLNDTTLLGRVERYARDIQRDAWQKALIIRVRPDQSTVEIARALEKLYREGDGTISEYNRLKGLVIIGDVPLPVVNKNGNRLVSLFPYTDFDDTYYVHDTASDDFVVNSTNIKPGAEVWHGVIRPPVSGEDGYKLLAEYFDKNHLFKIGDSAYKDFDKKIFYSDLNKEFNLISTEGIPAYQSYLKYWEDISYFRFNKNWAKKLFGESSMGRTGGDGVDNDGDTRIDEDTADGYDDDGDAEAGSPLFGLINRVDDDRDGKVDNDEEGVWGYCSAIPAKGKKLLENCQAPGQPYKTGNFYHTKAGSKYFVADDINNNDTVDQRIDEGIDEDDGDPMLRIDNDRDGRVDEDTTADNDADGDKKSDEDGPGDMNGDRCPGQCKVDEDNDSVDADSDFWPTGYEKDYGSLDLTIAQLGDLISAAANGSVKEAFASLKTPNNPENFLSFPRILLFIPPFPPILFPRIFPFPNGDEWIDEGSVNNDDEDDLVDEDGTADNDNDQDGSMDEDGGDVLGNGGKGDGGNMFDNLPDIRSKDVIMSFFKKYNELFDNFYTTINSWVDGTGRYQSGYKSPSGQSISDLVTFPFLIAAKDEFTRVYLKSVNDALERRIDNYVQKLQYDVTLSKGANLSGYIVLPDDNGVFPANQKLKFQDISFINFGYRNDSFFSGIEALLDALKTFTTAPISADSAKRAFLKTLKGSINALTPIYINGKPIDSITNIVQCSLYRGSEGDENSQMVIGNTVYDPLANFNKEKPPQMPAEWNAFPREVLTGDDDNDYEGLFWWWGNHRDSPLVKWLVKQRLLNKSFAGCFAENASDPTRCFPGLATRYIFSLGGTRQVKGIPASAVSHQACFDFKEKDGYDAYALAANIYLKFLSETQMPEEKEKLNNIKPAPSSAQAAPRDIVLLDFGNADKAPLEYEIAPGNFLAIPPTLTVMAMASPTLSKLKINFEQILKAYLGGDRLDNNANGSIDEAAEASMQFFAINSSNHQVNWTQVGEQLLSTVRNDEAAVEAKNKPLLFGPNVIAGAKEVYIRVNPIPGKPVSSLAFHKEPTIDTIQAQTYELERDANGDFIEDKTLSEQARRERGRYKTVTKTVPDPADKSKNITVSNETRTAISIPIDSPRYVTFMDSKGNYQKIIYPNAFRAKDLGSFRQQLVDLEKQLQAIQVNPAYASLGPASVSNYLTGVMESTLATDVVNTSLDEISVVAEKKLADALNWKALDIDEKHDYVLRHYWGSGFKPYTPLIEAGRGYEVLYLNSSGGADALSMKFNKDIPSVKNEPLVEKVDCKQPANAGKAACRGGVDVPVPGGTVGAGKAGGAGTQGEALDESVIIFEWFPRLQKWAAETADIIKGKNAVKACPAGGFTDLPGDTGLALESYRPPVVLPVPLDTDGNGRPDQADATRQLRLTLADPNRTVLRAGSADQVEMVVEALDGRGQVNLNDSFNTVTLRLENLSGSGQIAVLAGGVNTDATSGGPVRSSADATLVNGRAVFIVRAAENSGTVAARAEMALPGGAGLISSDTRQITVSKEVIKLTSYRRYNTYKFAENGAAGYSVHDENGALVADIDPKTGYISLLAKGHEVRVLPASGSKPLRQAIVRLADDKVLAILYFVVAGRQPVVMDTANVDYAKQHASLKGVHAKDLVGNDNLKLQPVTDEPDLTGALQLVDSRIKENGGRVAVIDGRGNLFTNLKIKVKTGPANGPVIFVLEDQGRAVLEMFVGAKFEVITTLPYEQVKNLFAAGVPALMMAGNWLIGKAHAQNSAATSTQTGSQSTGLGASGSSTKNSSPTASVGTISATAKVPRVAELPDTDKDGLNDLEEINIGTKINQADTNGDGQSDLANLQAGVDPRVIGKTLFSDIKPGEEGFAEIVNLFRRGVLVADEKGQVRPKNKITREEFIKFDLGGICVLCDRFESKIQKNIWDLYSKNPFPDRDIADQYKYCVAEGKNRGIISGYKAFINIGLYVPKANISRAEATKVILETARQQIESFPAFVVNENLRGKPWYYNYLLTAQKEGIYPRGKFTAMDTMSPAEFQKYLDNEIIRASSGLPGGLANSSLLLWLSQPISRVEFAIMVSRFTDRYNCNSLDKDGDGLPDNFEKYIYATSPTDADTDKGGVNDGAEVWRGSNPLDASDDFPKPKENPDDDPDKDWLTTGRERQIGTDPYDPDTDDGGVKDGMEVLLGINPLEKADDKTSGQGSGLESNDKDGAYLSGLDVRSKTIYSLPDGGAIDQSQINTEETDRLPADDESELYVRATLYDANGELKENDNSSVVRFAFKNPEDAKSAMLEQQRVRVQNGRAETVLTAKTKTGLPIITASLENQKVPSDQRLIEVYALEPAKALITAQSPIIPSGGKSSTMLKAQLLDRNGNLANSGSYTATFTLEQAEGVTAPVSAQLESKVDEIKDVAGIQMSSVTGEYELKLKSGISPENLRVKIAYQDKVQLAEQNANNATADLLNLGAQIFKPAEVIGETTVATRNDLALIMRAGKTGLASDAQDETEITVSVEDALAQRLDKFTGLLNVKILNAQMGTLVSMTGKTGPTLGLELINGEAKFKVRSSLKAGEIVLSATVEGLPPAALKLESFAYRATRLVLESSASEIDADPRRTYSASVKLYDSAGNLVKRDNSTLINFSLDPESAKFAKLTSGSQVRANSGMASVNFQTGTLTGPVRLRAKAAGLIDGYLEIYAVKKFRGEEFRQIKPKFLYADLLGANYGDVTTPGYLGGWFVFSGKVQSAVSMITEPKPKLRLADVLTSGSVIPGDEADLEIRVQPTGSDNAVTRQIVSDIGIGQEVMEITVVPKPQTQLKIVSTPEQAERRLETINVVNMLLEDSPYSLENEIERVNVLRAGQLIATIGRDARIRLFSPTLTLERYDGGTGREIDWVLADKGNALARVIMTPGNLGEVKLLEENMTVPQAPGVYLRKLASISGRAFQPAFSGNSTVLPRGYSYLDETRTLDKSKGPGLAYLSLESADTEDGVGLRGENKNVLLFAAGNTVGQANLHYASDGGVVLGDPTVRVDNQREPGTLDKLYSATGFTRDIGRMIFAGDKPVKEVATMDYDNDGDSDALVIYKNGEIKLLENLNGGKGFADRGMLLNFPNGVLSQAVLDINDDGWQDLVVATADSCKVGEVCLDAYLNKQSSFVRQNLKLAGYNAKNKIYMLRAADMNQDSYQDLVVSDDTGTIKIFYVRAGNVDTTGSTVGNLGVKINSSTNLKAEVFAYYSGMVGNQPGLTDDKNFEKVVLAGVNSASDRQVEIKSVGGDSVLGNSVKTVRDVTEPFNVLAEGDQLEYSLKIVNSGGAAVSDLLIGDIVPENTSLQVDSIKCVDCTGRLTPLETGQSLRPYLLSGIDLPAGGSRTITYRVTVKDLPKVKIAVGQNLSSKYPVRDGYPDIAATPENNPTGKVVYYYSTGKNAATGKVNYAEMVISGDSGAGSGYKPATDASGKTLGLDLRLLEQKGADGMPVALKHFLDYGTFPGLDLGGAAGGSKTGGTGGSGDTIAGLPGIGDAYAGLQEGLESAAGALQAGIAALTCSGGCIPMPINYSFLTPGPINVMGVPGGFDPGLPVFAWGVPSIIPVWPPSPYQGSLGGRLYVSPTLTGKVAMSTCLGPYLIGFGPLPGNCFTVVLPVDPLAGLCKAIAGAIEGTLAGANELISDGSGTLGTASDGSLADSPTADGKNYTGGFQGATSLGNYGYKVNARTNIRIPGFPSVLTDWLDNQSSEIINKLTDLPDIYVLLPDLLSPFRPNASGKNEAVSGADNLNEGNPKVKKEPVTEKGLRQVLAEINKIPMINIVPQEVLIKIPSLTPAEIDRFINDAKQWVEDEKAELERVKSIWKCGPFREKVTNDSGQEVPGYIDANGRKVYGERPYMKFCDMLTVDMTKLIQSVEKNIETLESYKVFPRQVLAWRNMLTKYVAQIICYIDAIVQFFVGNISKWMNQANGWVDAVATLVETIATWKLLFDLVVDYQASCDKCTSARFSLLELILKLFAIIPSPPVIPFPKLPDIYLDFSQVQLGVKILWPDLKFRPERLVLPKLPRIVLPELPTFRIELPTIPQLPPLPTLPDLPDLPPLTLPALPNLPPPPKIPALPGAIKATINVLKVIFKILCLIKKGLIPTHETVLKPTVEHMTERGLSPLLPFDLGLAFQAPSISYNFVNRVVLSVKINLNKALNFTVLYDVVKLVADKLNVISTNFAGAANNLTKTLEALAAGAANTVNSGLDAVVPDGNAGGSGAGVGSTSGGAGGNPLLNYLREWDSTTVDTIGAALSADPQLARDLEMFSPQLAGAMAAFHQNSIDLTKEASRYQAMIDSGAYDDIELVAGQVRVTGEDALAGRSIDEIEKIDWGNLLAGLDGDFQETRKLANLRDNLLAMAKENQDIDRALLAENDLQKMGVLLAEAPTASEALTAAGFAGGSMIASTQAKLYAQVPSLNDIVSNSGLPANIQNKPVAKGMFIYNENLKQNEKILNYEEELSSPITMNFIDTDEDSDKDLLYSLGNNLYIKENYSRTGNMGAFYAGQPQSRDLQDYVPARPAVRGLISEFSGNKTVDLKWLADGGEGLAGYEVLIGDKLGGAARSGVTNAVNIPGLLKMIFLTDSGQVAAPLTNSLLQPVNENTYQFPPSVLQELIVTEVSGDIVYNGPEQIRLIAGGEKVRLQSGWQVMAIGDSKFKIWEEGQEKNQHEMLARELITMPESFGGQLEIQLASGAAVLIKTDKQSPNQRLLPGSKIETGIKYTATGTANALIKLSGDSYTRLDPGQSLQVEVLADASQPSATIKLENGFYYATIKSLYRNGFRGLISESALLWPNICADRQAPLPLAGPTERLVAIFKTINIDAGKSFDAFGKIQKYYLDTDLATDSDNDGNATNDSNLGRDKNPAVDSDGNGVSNDDLDEANFVLGPYTDLSTRKVMLNVVDESGNTAQQEITIKVYVPAITLDPSSGATISGNVDGAEANMPVAIIRDRAGVREILRTDSANADGKYFTDSRGQFSINDLALAGGISIKNAAGKVVAEVDPDTGRVILRDPSHRLEILPAEEPLLPTRLNVRDAQGRILATLFIVVDGNMAVAMEDANTVFDAAKIAGWQGVHLKNLQAGDLSTLELKNISTDAAKFGGGVELVEKSTLKRLAVLDRRGDFYIYDNRLKLGLTTAKNLEDPLVIDVAMKQPQGDYKLLTQFYTAFGNKKSPQILDAKKFKMFSDVSTGKGPKFDTDKDGMPDLWEQQYGFDIDNPADAALDTDQDKLKNLDEYRGGTNPLLADTDGDSYSDSDEKIFGKDPLRAATSPFADVNEKTPYYGSILNFFQRGILAGIPAGNRLKFGLNEPINRAEYAKVMLDTFCIVPRPEARTAPAVFTDIPYQKDRLPWYFAATKEAYFQGFITGYRGQIDKKTGRTPFAPEATITKAEAVKIILEALERDGVINLSAIPVTEPYYLPYMQAAQNLQPYLRAGVRLKNTFLLTADEAARPDENLNRGEFIKLADRVLAARDCSLIDGDGDGMPDFWEKQKGLNPLKADADLDPDRDRLINGEEYRYGTDPLNADTDRGGIKDGVEVLDRQTNPLDPKDDYLDSDGDGLSDSDEIKKYGTKPGVADTDGGGVNDGDEVLKNATNPLNPLDDLDTDKDLLGDRAEQTVHKTNHLDPDTDDGGVKDGAEVFRGTDPLNPADDLLDMRRGLEPGVYVVPPDCASCPCLSAVEYMTDLLPGDKLMAIISDRQNDEIFSESNIVVVK